MADIHHSRSIAACPQKIWDVLADFGSISSWADNVDHSCILFSAPDGGSVGTARRIQVKRDALVERVTEFDPPHALAYDIEGLPRRLRRVANRWTLAEAPADLAGSTVVTLTSTVEIGLEIGLEIGSSPVRQLAERLVCRFLARQSDVLLAGLANRLENACV